MLTRELNVAQEFPAPTYEDWRKLVDLDLKGAPFERKLVTHTYEGIYIKPLYTAADWSHGGDPTGFSGVGPFTRGAYPLGTSQCGWDIRQEHASATAADLNTALLDDLTHGVTSIVLRLDTAGRQGLDADDPRAGLLIGGDGVSLSTPADFAAAFNGVYLNMIGVGLESGAAFVPAAAQLAALWEAAGVAPDKAHGQFNADPLAVLARDGVLPYSIEEGLTRAADLAVWTSGRYRNVAAVRVGTAVYHHAGATATQDLAFSMATALEYLRAMTAAGLTVDQAARQITFSYAIGCGFFLAISKLRAARRLWARIVEASGGGAEAQRMTMHVRPSKRVLTTRDPWVNLLRNSVCVFAAGVAGADAVGSIPFDAPLGTPSPLGRRIARNTQIILQEESHLHRVADPAGGCWYLESLTDELAEKAWVILQAIEGRGGMSRSLGDGFIASQIDSAFAPRQKNLAIRKDPITGVSEFPNLGESLPAHPTTDPATLREATRARTAAYRKSAKDVGTALKAIGSAQTPGTRSAAAYAAAVAGATLGQINAALNNTVGEARIAAAITIHPFAEPFERLRTASDEYLAECGSRPRAFIASMGTVAQHNARTAFATNFFETGGFETVTSDGYTDVNAAVSAFRASGASIAVICSTDELYDTVVPELAPALHRAGARTVVLAGNPGAKEATFLAAGVDRFIFVRCDVVRTLTELLKEEGVLA